MATISNDWFVLSSTITAWLSFSQFSPSFLSVMKTLYSPHVGIKSWDLWYHTRSSPVSPQTHSESDLPPQQIRSVLVMSCCLARGDDLKVQYVRNLKQLAVNHPNMSQRLRNNVHITYWTQQQQQYSQNIRIKKNLLQTTNHVDVLKSCFGMWHHPPPSTNHCSQ